MLAKVGAVKGVSSSGTVAQASRFHDDKTTYTGAHAAGGALNKYQKMWIVEAEEEVAAEDDITPGLRSHRQFFLDVGVVVVYEKCFCSLSDVVS